MFLLLEADTALPRFWEGRYRTAASLQSTIPNWWSMRQARPVLPVSGCRRQQPAVLGCYTNRRWPLRTKNEPGQQYRPWR